ncbi:MAG: polysaccharide biosynthesis/export family protein [Flavobacteriales bacterium]|nr:polysaccharide biosynthesis/export family protein [Flavobacteriales bacterium]
MRITLKLIAFSLLLGSCTVNKDLLFKTPTDYAYDTVPDTVNVEVVIAPNNLLTFNFFTGNGHILVEQAIGNGILSGGVQNNQNMLNPRNQINYLVNEDGTVKLPVLGRVKLDGLSLREAEDKLENLYSEFYNDPFVLLRVENNRVIVSPGAGGTAQVITLINANTTLMEALAMAGGVNDRGNSSQIKLLRENRESGEREIYLIDLSTIEGIENADMIVQANDIIYVEPLPLIARELVQEIAPIITLITTAALLITLVNAQ